MSPNRIIVERDVETAMRDGTILRANIFRPDVAERLPVLLQRTPYGKDGSDLLFCLGAAGRGYAVVAQDTRGRWASEGAHYPFRDEFEDGYDTVQWAAGQPWSNGAVGMWGGSYVGYTQWAAAAMHPPALRAIFPSMTFTDLYGDAFRPGGALALGAVVSWGLGSGAMMAIQRLQVPPEEKDRLMGELADALDGMGKGGIFRTLPLSAIPLLNRPDIGQPFQDMFSHLEYDALWARMDIRQRLSEIDIPAYHLGGWYDLFVRGTLGNYTTLRQHGPSERTRRGQKLVMGPWLHGPLSGQVGDVDFGVRGSDMLAAPGEMSSWRWFDYWLKGEQNGILDEPAVRIFVMGSNRWRTEAEWPLARAVATPYYLHSRGMANTLCGNGALAPQPPAVEPPDGYTYDPKDPVPTRGGGLCCWGPALPAGAYDQRKVEERQDVLVYTSEMLEGDLEVTGPVQVMLYAASSAVDTDFTAKLVDVGPCGYARNVCDGIVRARYREGTHAAKLLAPGEVVQYVIDLGATANVFLAGHRIRVEISSSNFPHYDRNPNTGHPAHSEEELKPARQTIHHDARHPSHVLLPVVTEA